MYFPAQVLFLVLSAAVPLIQAVLEVSIPTGPIIAAEDLTSRNGLQIYCFRGIPYAQAPVGKLRFKDPQPALPWKKPRDGSKRCPQCAQIKVFGDSKGNHLGEENCLCLSIHTTSMDRNAKLPVMFYIHGGGYKMHSSNAGQPEFINTGDIVLVDVNYRLGALGFSTTGDGAIPGNLGLKDQLLALKWVKDHIHIFGGDPDKVTVFGDSAGGASSHLMLLSPAAKGLVHRGISMSGTAMSPLAFQPQQLVIERTKDLGKQCGCSAESSEKLLECLQNAPLSTILDASKSFSDELDLPVTPFAPVIESPKARNPFITKHPKDMTSELPWIMGITSADSLGLASRLVAGVAKNNLDLEEKFDSVLPKILQLDQRYTRANIPAVIEKIKKFYFRDESITKENIYKMDELVSDAWFLKGIIDSSANYKGKTYLYYYDYLQTNEANSFSTMFGSPIKKKGASHGDDLLNLFPYTKTFFPKRTLSKMDTQVSEKMIHLWTTFAKYGELSRNNITKWEPMDKKRPTSKYLYIGAQGFKQMENLFMERAQFWESLEDVTLTA